MYQSQTSLERNQYIEHPFSDAHCHLNLFERPLDIVNLAVSSGISLLVTAGGSKKDNDELVKLLSLDRVFGVIGIAPDFIADAAYISEIKKIATSNKKIVGFGEIGLDYKIAKDAMERQAQEKIFRAQLELANELNLPVVIHARQALREAIDIASEIGIRAMLHFFEGGEEEAKLAEKREYLISVPPVETSRRLRAIRAVDLKTLVTETDSPVVGKTPIDAKKSAEMIAKAKGAGIEEVADITTENLREFFYI